MTCLQSQPITFINAATSAGASCVRIAAGYIVALDVKPQPGDIVIDLAEDRLLPGLINAHDHLQLNHFPRLKFRERYDNCSQWIGDLEPRLEADDTIRAGRAVPRAESLRIGGLKNLLSGVTTVAHHDPLFAPLLDDFPVRVVANYGWSHSLHLDGPDRVREACRHTPTDQPWIIHAAEGTDADAHGEFEQLAALGCVRQNTVLVHGIALDSDQRRRLCTAGASLIWCPTSNLFLFQQTAQVADLLARGVVALGSDSRLTGAGDLLCELSIAREIGGLDEPVLESIVTGNAARLLRIPDRGTLAPGALADLLILPAEMPLSRATRADVRLVMIGGVMRYADPDYAESLHASRTEIVVDGRAKCMASGLAAQMALASVQEPGVDLSAALGRAA